MRYLGLDLGTVTLGIAISRTGIFATGYEEFRFDDSNWEQALNEVIRVVNLEKIDVIALGLPLNMTGTDSEMTKNSRNFANMIQKALPSVKISLVDERWSTKQATRSLLESDLSRNKRKKVIDKMAAQIILETLLERGY